MLKYNMTNEEDLALRQIVADMDAYQIANTHKLDKLKNIFEEEKIRVALVRFNYNRTHTAEFLGISRTNLIAKIKKYNIE
jgi:DNA-binding NtrC family response regulator